MEQKYQPTVAQMTDSAKWQQLSCTEGGAFDALHKQESAWGKASSARHVAGTSRSARIKRGGKHA